MADVLANLDAHQAKRDAEQRRKYPKQFLGIDPSAFVSEKQSQFIDYMLDPNHGTQTQWARDNDLNPNTVSQWKKERFFMEEWDKRAKKVNGGIEKVQRVIDALFTQAVAGDVKAMSLYLQYVEKFTPTRKVVEEDRSVQDMTDEELAAQLDAQSKKLRKGA